MKHLRVWLLTAALTACGHPTPASAPATTPPAVQDTEVPASDDDAVIERTFTFGTRLAAQDTQTTQPLSVTVGVYRARSGKYLGLSRARAVFTNASGAALAGSVHAELAPADGGPVTSPVYDSAKVKIGTGMKKTVQTTYDSPQGRQCARVWFTLTAQEQTFDAPADTPLTVCDVDDQGQALVGELLTASTGTRWPGIRVSEVYGTQVPPVDFTFTFWPDQFTPPSLEEVQTRFAGEFARFDRGNYGRGPITLERAQVGDYERGVVALTTYGGDCKTAPEPVYVCRWWKQSLVNSNAAHWKKVFKLMSYSASAGKRLYSFTFTPETKADGYKAVPQFVAMTATGPLGTAVLYVNTVGVDKLDPPYFRSLP